MTTVFDDQSGKPGLHALVVGIGDYGPAVQDSMALVTAVQSAQAVLEWLYTEYQNPAAPLRTIEVALSPPSPSPTHRTQLNLPARGPLAASTMSVEDARRGLTSVQGGGSPGWGVAGSIEHLYNRAHADKDNVVFVYLCGHGGEVKGDPHLFCAQFDTTKPAAALGAAVDLSKFVSAMSFCLARKQLFLFDCCRDQPSWAAGFNDTADGVLTANIDVLPVGTPPLKIACLYAVPSGERAGANDGITRSRFATALLQVLRGPAWDSMGGASGAVSTRNLATAIEDLLLAGVLPPGTGPHVAQGDRFAFHVPLAPEVPVVLDTVPALQLGEQLEVSGSTCVLLASKSWSTWKPVGAHIARVMNGANTVRCCDIVASPTVTRRTL